MIGKYMRGRLGNQLFQYATLRYIQEINGNKDKLILNFSKYVYSKGFENELNYFNIKEFKESDNIKITVSQQFYIILFRIIKRLIRLLKKDKYYQIRNNIEKKSSKFLIKKGIYWKEDGYLNILPTNKKNKIVIGHFESSKNFNPIREKLLKEITPKEKPLKSNKQLYDIINSTNSVCVSIRRGDFVDNKKFSKIFNVCGINYFTKAIDIMQKKIKDPVFIIFSDDIEWCKKNINIKGKMYFENGKDPVWEKIRLMYNCKHFILSNSTFSWWAQYLSRNEQKIVIAPSRWLNKGFYKDIYDDNWILIDN